MKITKKAKIVDVDAYLDVASRGQVVDLKAMVNSDGCIDCCDIDGNSALWLAIERGIGIAVETLLKAGADVNKTYQSRQTPLMLAVDRGRTEYVQVILDAGAKVDSVNSFGTSALMIACQKRNVEILQMLVAAGASVQLKDFNGKTGLMIAVENNGCECLKYLLDAGATININDFQANSPLVTAVCQNCETCVQTLIQAGASVNEVQRFGKTILKTAVERAPNVLQVLIQNGAKLDATDNRKKTATMYAAGAGRVTSLVQLLQAGVNLNLKDEAGQTALIVAAQAGHSICVECLVKAGARQEVRDDETRTALMLAASGRHPECLGVLLETADNCKEMQCRSGKTALMYAVGTLRDTIDTVGTRDFKRCLLDTSMKCIRILLNAGASPVICDKSGMSSLMYAARVDVLASSFQDLVNAGADINMSDRSGLTALGHAACCANVEFIKKLVEAGVSVNALTHAGETPLLILSKDPGSSIACDSIVYLLDHNADVNVQDPKGMTPLMWAAKSAKGKNAMSLLIDHGADINMIDKLGFSALHHTVDQGSEVLINARYLLDKRANPNLRTAEGKSAVSLAVRDRNRAFLELLLEYNADPFIDWTNFCNLIQSGDRKMLQFVVSLGLFSSPAVAHNRKLKDSSSVLTLTNVLNTRCLPMAKFLLVAGYLSNSDFLNRSFNFSQVPRFCIYAHMNQFFPHPTVTTFIHNVCSQPWPLVKLTFAAVSSSMGSGADRENRVRRSGLPSRLQRMLLFQESVSKLCVNHWDSIPLCFNPDEYEKLPKPRPLLFYWPFGRDLTPCECCQTGFRFV